MIQSNFLSPLNFILKMNAIPNTEYLVQQATIPGMTLGVAATPSPFVTVVNPGNITYDELVVSFKVGEDLADYLEIFNWMVQLGHPDNLGQYAPKKSDATLLIMDSAKNPKIEIKFTDCFPTGLTQLDLDTTLSSVQYITAGARFRFQRFYYNVIS